MLLLRVASRAAKKSTSAPNAPSQPTSPMSTVAASPPSTSRRRTSSAYASSSSAFDASTLLPAQVVALASSGDAESRRALFREAVADAAGALYSTLLTDDSAAAKVLPPPRLAEFERNIGYSFPKEHAWLLRAALVHKSYRAEAGRYAAADVLSWHGDACLYSLLAESMIAAYPSAGISDLTPARVGRISRESLSKLAREAGMDSLVLVGKSFVGISSGGGGAAGSGCAGLSTGMLGESFEAVLGAVAASGGMDAVRSSYFRMAPLPGKLRTLMAETMRSSSLKG